MDSLARSVNATTASVSFMGDSTRQNRERKVTHRYSAGREKGSGRA